MKLKLGDPAPDFDVLARQAGRDRALHLRELLTQKHVVLYFYPRDFTRVCTKETCGFRDMYAELQAEDTEIIGVSVDDAESHDRFASEHGVTFPLVSDPERRLARQYGATSIVGDLMGLTARVTFVIERGGRVVGIFDSMGRASQHLDGVKQAISDVRRRAGDHH